MSSPPTLETGRLVLRPFTSADAEAVAFYAGDERVSATTLNIPYPYTLSMAYDWLGRHRSELEAGRSLCLALTLKGEGGEAIGAVALGREDKGDEAELGYWLGVPFWGRGYMTEAAQALIAYGFAHWGLCRINSHHLARNPASGRVMEKAGMTRQERRSVIWKGGQAEEAVFYTLIKQEAGH